MANTASTVITSPRTHRGKLTVHSGEDNAVIMLEKPKYLRLTQPTNTYGYIHPSIHPSSPLSFFLSHHHAFTFHCIATWSKTRQTHPHFCGRVLSISLTVAELLVRWWLQTEREGGQINMTMIDREWANEASWLTTAPTRGCETHRGAAARRTSD